MYTATNFLGHCSACRIECLSGSEAKLVRRHDEHTQATPDQPIDEEQLYYDTARDYPKGRVYGLGSLAKRKRRYADPSASTSQELMVRCSEFDAVVQRLAQFEATVTAPVSQS
ncbi:hypothetical protein Scep_021705 [Stephania cephalantha]|uniref:Uncharacterized protein n=1 Tax=Stephania cephalantha TaxID=152367 RepID=A0AAP0F514_9MAGN